MNLNIFFILSFFFKLHFHFHVIFIVFDMFLFCTKGLFIKPQLGQYGHMLDKKKCSVATDEKCINVKKSKYIQ